MNSDSKKLLQVFLLIICLEMFFIDVTSFQTLKLELDLKATQETTASPTASPTAEASVEPTEYTAQEMMDKLVTGTETEATYDDTIKITYDDAQKLMRIAQAEAGIDGVEGMAAIMLVVLARVNDPRFPSTVEGVIFQPGQFSPIDDGRYYTVEITTEAHLALAEIEKGTYSSSNLNEAIYFVSVSCENSWQSENCSYVTTVGHHNFYK